MTKFVLKCWKTNTCELFSLNFKKCGNFGHISRTVSSSYISKPKLQWDQLAPTTNCYSAPKTKFTCGCLTKSPYLQNGWAQYTPTVSVRNFGSSAEEDKPNTKPSLYQRFKAMYRDYWYVLVPVHLVTSAAWFGGFYYLASSGFDIVSFLEYLHVSEKVINPLRNGHATTGYLAISYALYKIATPVRYTVTLGGTTVSINYLKKWGYIKPVPSKERLKELFEDQKEMIKEKGQTMKDNMLQTFKPTESKKKSP
uniref:DUF1279 domain-containing protein n=1 Tax=Homalodisca liturata TaxID=320908 RepID=A0A1B6HH03_9HEMI